MTAPPLFPGFDGLMTLSRREGVDIRPTLLRVLTDLYVQARGHTRDEEAQFVELTSRLIDQVDDATRAAVRARLSIYSGAPVEVLHRLGLNTAGPKRQVPLASKIPEPVSAESPVRTSTETQLRMASNLPMRPSDAADISEMFFRANASERALMLDNLRETPLKPAGRIPAARATLAVETLEMAAFAADVENFTLELGEALVLPALVAAQVVADPGGEPLACAARALDMPSDVFQRVLLFLNPDFGSSVHNVYRLSRLYDRLGERSSLIMLAAWRGSATTVARAKYRPGLYDDERHRGRAAPSATRPAVQPGSIAVARKGSQGSGR